MSWFFACQGLVLAVMLLMCMHGPYLGAHGRLRPNDWNHYDIFNDLKQNPLFQGDFRGYTLHNYSVAPSQTFETLAESTKCIQAIKHKQKDIYGVLFHPEVRNQEILKRFVQLIH